jgi:hypothetical protein
MRQTYEKEGKIEPYFPLVRLGDYVLDLAKERLAYLPDMTHRANVNELYALMPSAKANQLKSWLTVAL